MAFCFAIEGILVPLLQWFIVDLSTPNLLASSVCVIGRPFIKARNSFILSHLHIQYNAT